MFVTHKREAWQAPTRRYRFVSHERAVLTQPLGRHARADQQAQQHSAPRGRPVHRIYQNAGPSARHACQGARPLRAASTSTGAAAHAGRPRMRHLRRRSRARRLRPAARRRSWRSARPLRPGELEATERPQAHARGRAHVRQRQPRVGVPDGGRRRAAGDERVRRGPGLLPCVPRSSRAASHPPRAARRAGRLPWGLCLATLPAPRLTRASRFASVGSRRGSGRGARATAARPSPSRQQPCRQRVL